LSLTEALSYDALFFGHRGSFCWWYVLFLDFESKNLIAENKKSCLPRIMDFSKISQVVCLSSFSLFMEVGWDEKYFDALYFF
jgi:hypothetical protein